MLVEIVVAVINGMFVDWAKCLGSACRSFYGGDGEHRVKYRHSCAVGLFMSWLAFIET
jgi:hypothetical protein